MHVNGSIYILICCFGQLVTVVEIVTTNSVSAAILSRLGDCWRGLTALGVVE